MKRIDPIAFIFMLAGIIIVTAFLFNCGGATIRPDASPDNTKLDVSTRDSDTDQCQQSRCWFEPTIIGWCKKPDGSLKTDRCGNECYLCKPIDINTVCKSDEGFACVQICGACN